MKTLIKILFFLGLSKRLRSTPTRYYATKDHIQRLWNSTLPWFSDPDCKNNGQNNYMQYGVNRGVFEYRAILGTGHEIHWPALWLLNINEGESYEEIDIELMTSPRKKRECLYLGTWINHKDSHGPSSPDNKHWSVRLCNRKLIRKLKDGFNDYAIEVRWNYIRWYINGRLVARQKMTIREKMYFVLSDVEIEFVTIRK